MGAIVWASLSLGVIRQPALGGMSGGGPLWRGREVNLCGREPDPGQGAVCTEQLAILNGKDFLADISSLSNGPTSWSICDKSN